MVLKPVCMAADKERHCFVSRTCVVVWVHVGGVGTYGHVGQVEMRQAEMS